MVKLNLRQKVITAYFLLSLFYAIIIGIVLKGWFTSQPYPVQFALGAVPIFALFSIIIGGIKKPKRIISSFILFCTADAICVPFLLNPDGTFGTAFLSEAASDVFLGKLLQGFGINGFLLYLMTYVVATTLLVSLAVFLIKDKDLKDEYD